MYLIPEPQQWHQKEGVFTMEYHRKIVLGSQCPSETYEDVQLLQADFKDYAGFVPAVTRGIPEDGDIYLQLGENMSEQEYTLLVQKQGICITGGSACGIFYGIQTLRQVIQQCGCLIPYMIIVDYPEIMHRGFYHDVTRGRIPTLDYLKKLVDRMAFYKLNQLQLYMEHTFMFREFSEVWRDDTPLTANDILELDAYCRKRHIELVPSIACFGHLYKVLRTRTYGALCELPDMQQEPFGFVDRMRHHTLDVSNPKSMELVKSLIDEFMPLFTSGYFNICADETFDLGKGKSANLAEEQGTQRLYLDFVRELCEYVVSKGKIPMFWGDIICEFPEAVKELPPETICLNWGYDRDWPEDSTRKLSEAGVRLYNCPGVSGWDQFVNQIRVSYENISRMCQYAQKYHAEGILNTDWGDCGHINHPDFSLPGMIYGAAFSWNLKIPEYEEMNRWISKLAYGDQTETLVSLVAQISETGVFTWRNAVDLLEAGVLQENCLQHEKTTGRTLQRPEFIKTADVYRKAVVRLEDLKSKLYQLMIHLPVGGREPIIAYLVALQGLILLQKVGEIIGSKETIGQEKTCVSKDCEQLAVELEYWLSDYKKLWRSTSRESELFRIQHVICCYADWLRGGAQTV